MSKEKSTRQFPTNALISYWVDGTSASDDVYSEANVVMVNLGYFSTTGEAKFVPQSPNMQGNIDRWHNQNKTVILSMGGTITPGTFPDAQEPQDWGFFFDDPNVGSHRAEFMASIMPLLSRWDFDGLDFDVEGASLVNSTDAMGFFDFATEVRTFLPGHLICLTVPAKSVIWDWNDIGSEWAAAPYNTLVPMVQQPAFETTFDLVQAMMYDMDGDPDRQYSSSTYSIDDTGYRAAIIYQYTNPHTYAFNDWMGLGDAQYNSYPGIAPSKFAAGWRSDNGSGYVAPAEITSSIIQEVHVEHGMVWESHSDEAGGYAVSQAVKQTLDLPLRRAAKPRMPVRRQKVSVA